jgi:tetratricopeptide (TPR) repeat protein
MSKSSRFFLILVPSVTVFFSSGCIMVLEIVAGRLVAKYLGASLYTWTSVIGVVLAGIAVGNYLGGRIADRFSARKTLAALFGISSVTCVAVVVFNNLVGRWLLSWQLALPLRVFSHVCLVFLLPSTLLGTISPVVAKMALDRGLPTGRTVGDIYAWGAAGSIVGTFLAGFYLIAAMGTVAIIWFIGAALLLMGILYWSRLWVLYLWAAILIALMTLGMAPAGWAEDVGSSLALRQQGDPSILYEAESQYSYIAVRQLSDSPDKRQFIQDNLENQSRIVMDDIRDVQAFYEQIFAAVTHLFGRGRKTLSVLAIGGGGYVIPRYVEQVWPGSRIDVAEIDPKVTEAAMEAFGLRADTPINTFAMDGRNYVDELLEKERKGEQVPRYDFIYEDAFTGYAVPYQLVTKEFNNKIAQILADDGLYLVNLIEVFDSGRFLGAVVNTLQQTFPDICVVSERLPHDVSYNFVIIAGNRKIDLQNLAGEEPVKSPELWILSGADIETLRKKAHGVILTDNYAPVENLLAPAVVRRSTTLLAVEYLEQAEALKKQEKWEESISKYREVISVEPAMSIRAYNEIGRILAELGRWEEAINAAERALEYNEKAQVKRNVSDIHYNIASALKMLGRYEQASQHMRQAIRGYRRDLAKKPNSAKTVTQLGNALAQVGNFSEATDYFQQAVNINPSEAENYLRLARALVIQQRYEQAIEQLTDGVRFMLSQDREDDAARLQTYLESVELERSKYNKQHLK